MVSRVISLVLRELHLKDANELFPFVSQLLKFNTAKRKPLHSFYKQLRDNFCSSTAVMNAPIPLKPLDAWPLGGAFEEADKGSSGS